MGYWRAIEGRHLVEELDRLLGNATRSIGEAYFNLPVDGGPAIYRERVYCYELYHQMRRRWPRQTPYLLNGELDKAAHPILTELEIGAVKPDLLVHRPGDMAGNHAIIEVKADSSNPNKIRKDLETLATMRPRAGYQRAASAHEPEP